MIPNGPKRVASGALIASSLLAACGEVNDPCAGLEGPASLELGGGNADTGFLEVGDGVEMEIECRPSGFWLVTPSIRTHGIHPGEADTFGDPDAPLVLVEAFLEEFLIGANAAQGQHLGLTRTDGAAELVQLFVVFGSFRCNEPPIDLVSREVTLRGEIADACGNTASDALAVVLVNDEPL